MKSQGESLIFVVTLLLASLAICAPAAGARSWGEVVMHVFDFNDGAAPLAGLIQGSDGNFYGSTAGGDGTLFKISPSGTLTTLYWFCQVFDPSTDSCLDGAEPYSALIKGSDGNFYGTTIGGGANPNLIMGGPGTVFQFKPSGTPTILYSFCSQANCTDGWNPDAGVIQGSGGNFYGTTYLGGGNGAGTVFQLSPSGTLTTLHSFCSEPVCADGGFPYAGLVESSDGTFFGTTTVGGGPNNGGTVFKLKPSGTLTTLHSFCRTANCADGQNPYSSLVPGGDGAFYGTTLLGGKNAQGTVFKITPSGTFTTLHSFTGGPDGSSPYASLVQGDDGDFFGTAFGGGAKGAGTVFKITPSGALTTLYSFCTQALCADGESPYGPLVSGSDGDFYGTTAGGANGYGTVFKVGRSLPRPTPTATPTPTLRPIKVVPKELTLKAEPNATATANITIENMGTGPILVGISEPKHNPPFSESPVGTFLTVPGMNQQVTITYSPINSTTSEEKSDSIAVKAFIGDPNQRKPIDVKLKGED